MQNTLLDILILGLLVLVFGSIYRKWPTRRLRFWILGWLFVVAHFGIAFFSPASMQGQDLIFALQISFLIVAGVNFILASSAVSVDLDHVWSTAAALSLPAIAFTFLIAFDFSNAAILNFLGAAGELCAILVTLRFYSGHRLIVVPSIVAAAIATAALFFSTEVHAPEIGIYAILTQIFFMNGVLYWYDFRRVSAGVVTAGVGLFAWAAVFPLGLLIQRFFPHVGVSSELWNIPKYFVEFGMVLTLLEDELTFAGRQREEYRVLFDGNPHPMWIFDKKTLAFMKVNEAAIQHYGYSRERFLSMTIRDIRPAAELDLLEQDINTGAVTSVTGPWTHVRQEGSEIKVEVAAHSIQFEGRDARFILVKDVTERQHLHEQLVHQAQHDNLTGLPNRLLLRDRMRQALSSAARHKQKAAVICIDLDRFKQINDTYGHGVGDLCLKQVALRLRERLRQVDTVARTGGEEFTIVLGELNTAQDAEDVAADLIEGFREPFELEGYSLDLAASLGIAIYPHDGVDADALWRSADAAMYRAKRSGGNQYLFVSREVSASTTEATELEMHMRRALKTGQGFELYYQPQYTLEGNMCGFEALIRLNHPRLGMVLPARFIPVAEESGLIVPVGNWVLEEVCRQSVEWQQQGLPQMRIALNISPLQFMRTDFSTQVQQVLAQFGMEPHFLELEMTETTVMRGLENVASQMRILSALGVQFSVDDFGTGYSSLRHLHQLPITTLKIDRSFIERICEPGGTYSIVQATLSLAHSLDMLVVAEGVENHEQFEALKSLGCDMLQGFLCSLPQRAADIPALLLAGSPVNLMRNQSASQLKSGRLKPGKL